MITTHRLLLPVSALLACTLACQAAEKPAEKAADPAAIGKRISFRPQNAQYQIQTSFNEDGAVRETEATLGLSLNASWPADLNPVAVTDIRITEAVLDSGETVVPRSINKDRLSSHFDSSGERHYGYIQVPLAAPAGPFASIKQVTGVIVLSVAGAPKEAELKPLSAFLGKSLALDGLDGAEITVERDKKRGISITMPSDLQKRLSKVTFADAAGAPISTNGWGGNGGGQEYKQTYTVVVPDDGAMTVSFYGDLTTVESPFSVSDIPMSAKPATKEKTKVTLKTTTPAPEKPAEKLKVKPEKTNF